VLSVTIGQLDSCACFDINGDGAIDLADFAENQTDFLGA